MSSLLIKNGRIIDKSQNLDEITDILSFDGKIYKIEKNIYYQADTIIDAKGLVVTAGLIDMHVHLREPGFEYKEDIISGANAALAGGFTSIVCMPNTNPAIDNINTVRYIKNRAKTTKEKIFITSCITKGLKGSELCDFEQLKAEGIIGITDDGKPVENDEIMEQAIIEAEKNNLVIISHCENLKIVKDGIINKGDVSKKLKVKGIGRKSEDEITKREVELARKTGAKIHIAHVSTKGSVEIIRQAKAEGVKVSAETCPHYFSLDESLLLKMDADYRMNPPLREKSDIEAIIEGLKDGTIDCIVTDHAPHSTLDKKNFVSAPNGVVGLETSLAAGITYLVDTNILSLADLFKLMSLNPANILGLDVGVIKEGAVCDLTIVDVDKSWFVNPNEFKSKSKNSPYKEMTLKGKVIFTVVNGEIAYNFYD